jgi:flagellar P-ring protein precursor FlgI
MKAAFLTAFLLSLVPLTAATDPGPVQIKIRDLTMVEGVRENPLIGYGMIVGLAGTGDKRQTVFTTQTLASVLQRMGAQIPAGAVRVNNVAAVFVTANLPAFARPGALVDITVSSIGDAKSLEGGMLLLTPLYGADGQVYAAAQGPVAVGGFSAGGGRQLQTVESPNRGPHSCRRASRAQSAADLRPPWAALASSSRAGLQHGRRNFRRH